MLSNAYAIDEGNKNNKCVKQLRKNVYANLTQYLAAIQSVALIRYLPSTILSRHISPKATIEIIQAAGRKLGLDFKMPALDTVDHLKQVAVRHLLILFKSNNSDKYLIMR